MKMIKSRIILKVIILIITTLSVSSVLAQEIKELDKDSITCLVKKYYDLNKKIFKENSQLEDIDKLFNLFTDEFNYIHPKYGGEYSRDVLYKGYLRNQKNGAYNGSVKDIKILNMIIGLNAIVVEKIFVTMENGELKEGNPEMTLFEFSDNKISRIFEYW